LPDVTVAWTYAMRYRSSHGCEYKGYALPWWWRRQVSPKHWCLSTKLRGVACSCVLCYNTVKTYTALNGSMTDEWDGSGRKRSRPNQGIIPVFVWRDWGKLWDSRCPCTCPNTTETRSAQDVEYLSLPCRSLGCSTRAGSDSRGSSCLLDTSRSWPTATENWRDWLSVSARPA
jgi:hypothetical protein